MFFCKFLSVFFPSSVVDNRLWVTNLLSIYRLHWYLVCWIEYWKAFLAPIWHFQCETNIVLKAILKSPSETIEFWKILNQKQNLLSLANFEDFLCHNKCVTPFSLQYAASILFCQKCTYLWNHWNEVCHKITEQLRVEEISGDHLVHYTEEMHQEPVLSMCLPYF